MVTNAVIFLALPYSPLTMPSARMFFISLNGRKPEVFTLKKLECSK